MLNIGYLIREMSSAKAGNKKTPALKEEEEGGKTQGFLKGHFSDILVF